jgi:hypothetical protein
MDTMQIPVLPTLSMCDKLVRPQKEARVAYLKAL